jgi:hypothetical protein
LNSTEKWIAGAAVIALAACITGLLLGIVGIFVSPPAQAALITILGSLTLVFFLFAAVIYFVARIGMILREGKQQKVMIQNEIDRLSKELNDLKM